MPRLILEGEPVGRDFYLSAPYIAVVKIIGFAAVNPPKAATQSPPTGLALVKYDAIVENTLRGTFPAPSISFYFFMNFNQRHPSFLRTGERYIVSLRTEGGVFRSFSDATQLKIEVDTGSHNQQDLPLQLGIESTISYILITPGNDLPMDKYHLGGYQNELIGAQDHGDLTPPKYAYELLRNVQKNGDPRVRATACRAAAIIFPILPKCITADIPDPTARPSIQDTLDFLQKTPTALLPKQSSEFLLQMLEIYTDDARPAIRAAACTDLRNIAPERKVANCR